MPVALAPLLWVAIPFKGSSRPRDQTLVSHTAGRFFTVWATREAHLYNTKNRNIKININMDGSLSLKGKTIIDSSQREVVTFPLSVHFL